MVRPYAQNDVAHPSAHVTALCFRAAWAM